MLKRELKRWDLVLLMINSVVGAGIFGLPSKIFSLAGIYSIAAIFICALLMLVIILNFSEVASRFKKTGGPYLYTLEAFGEFPGYIIAWLALISRIAAYAALINTMPLFETWAIQPWCVSPESTTLTGHQVSLFLSQQLPVTHRGHVSLCQMEDSWLAEDAGPGRYWYRD